MMENLLPSPISWPLFIAAQIIQENTFHTGVKICSRKKKKEKHIDTESDWNSLIKL